MAKSSSGTFTVNMRLGILTFELKLFLGLKVTEGYFIICQEFRKVDSFKMAEE